MLTNNGQAKRKVIDLPSEVVYSCCKRSLKLPIILMSVGFSTALIFMVLGVIFPDAMLAMIFLIVASLIVGVFGLFSFTTIKRNNSDPVNRIVYNKIDEDFIFCTMERRIVNVKANRIVYVKGKSIFKIKFKDKEKYYTIRVGLIDNPERVKREMKRVTY